MTQQKISIAHSPDTDDIFMFYALKQGLVHDADFAFDFTAEDIGELNTKAHHKIYDITALSFHAYAHVSHVYDILKSGASMAENDYGPILVASEKTSLQNLSGQRIAVPGLLTTATLLLRMMLEDFTPIVLPAHQIINAVLEKKVAAGLVIHEGQIHYQNKNLHVIAKTIETWKTLANDLPLPLGLSAIKKDLDPAVKRKLSLLQQQSIAYALSHRQQALEYARQAAPELSLEQADHYLHWYANDRTLNLGEQELAAIHKLFELALAKNLIPRPVDVCVI